MDIVITGFGTKGQVNEVLNDALMEWFNQNEINRCILFLPDEKDYTVVQGLLQAKFGKNLEVIQLPTIQTSELTSSNDLRNISWNLLEELKKHIDTTVETTIFLGRGSALHDHLLWFISQCYERVHALNIDSLNPILELDLMHNPGEIATNSFAALFQKFIVDMNGGFYTFKESGLADANWISSLPNSAIPTGVQSTFRNYIDDEMIEKIEIEKSSVVYRIKPNGLDLAMRSYFDSKSRLIESKSAGLTICFGRIPHIQSQDSSGQKIVQDFFKMISPLHPIEGLLTIFQRHDDSIEGSHILSLEDAIEQFKDSNFIGDLRYLQNSLYRKGNEEYIDMANHLILLNPNTSIEFQFEFVIRLTKECLAFEERYGPKQWKIDLTGPLIEVRSAASFFSIVSRSQPTWLLRPGKNADEPYFFRKKEYVLQLPNRILFETMSHYSNLHGSQKGEPNCLVLLMLYEDSMKDVEMDDLFDFSNKSSNIRGASKEDLLKFQEQLSTPYDLKGGTSNLYRTFDSLSNQGLVRILPGSQGKKSFHFELTDEGYFIARRLREIKEREVMH